MLPRQESLTPTCRRRRSSIHRGFHSEGVASTGSPPAASVLTAVRIWKRVPSAPELLRQERCSERAACTPSATAFTRTCRIIWVQWAYLTMRCLDLTHGRQRLSWATGFAHPVPEFRLTVHKPVLLTVIRMV